MNRRLSPLGGVRSGPGVLTGAALLLVFLGLAVSIDYPRTALGFKGDEATYYMLAHSLAQDGDFTYQRHDVTRVWEEFPGPEGVFLKRGSDITGVDFSLRPPFVHLVTQPDPSRSRLYFAKSFIYPLFAAPFVRLFGTNGFLVFHGLLLALSFAAAYTFLCVRGSARPLAAAYAVIFIFASAVPIYFVSIAPEFFNFAVVLLACFLWTYKRALPAEGAVEIPQSPRLRRFLTSAGSDWLAAVLLGIVTFSKPTNVFLILPLLGAALLRRDWRNFFVSGVLFGATTASLFVMNAAITGEFNYQGGDRKSFYSSTGFPLVNSWETFDNRGARAATDAVPTDVLVHGDTARVFAWNALYFVTGRYSGFIPYFFPGAVAVALFLWRRERRSWQWLLLGVGALGAVALLLYMPYTYSGGGGPIGNRYYLSYYPVFLFLLPALRSVRPLLVALGIGALFTAKLTLNPFYFAFQPSEPAKSGPLRLLPIELTLLNDLPVSGDVDRARRQLAGTPPMYAYFPDNGTHLPEGEWFWVRGGARADVILRAPAPAPEGGTPTPLQIERLTVEVVNGAVPNRVRVSGRFGRGETLDLQPGEARTVEITPGGGVPFKPSVYPTNWVYTVTLSTTAGSAPFLDAPGHSNDSRILGAMVRLVPHYKGR